MAKKKTTTPKAKAKGPTPPTKEAIDKALGNFIDLAESDLDSDEGDWDSGYRAGVVLALRWVVNGHLGDEKPATTLPEDLSFGEYCRFETGEGGVEDDEEEDE